MAVLAFIMLAYDDCTSDFGTSDIDDLLTVMVRNQVVGYSFWTSHLSRF